MILTVCLLSLCVFACSLGITLSKETEKEENLSNSKNEKKEKIRGFRVKTCIKLKGSWQSPLFDDPPQFRFISTVKSRIYYDGFAPLVAATEIPTKLIKIRQSPKSKERKEKKRN